MCFLSRSSSFHQLSNGVKATVTPLWSVWPSSLTVPVSVPVSGVVGVFEQFKNSRINIGNIFRKLLVIELLSYWVIKVLVIKSLSHQVVDANFSFCLLIDAIYPFTLLNNQRDIL